MTGETLKILRESAEMSQKTLADMMQTVQPYISLLECKNKLLSDEMRDRACAIFGINIKFN